MAQRLMMMMKMEGMMISVVTQSVLLVILSGNGFKNPEAAADLITTTCEKTLYKNLCIASLKSDKESEGADLHGLGKISLKNALAEASEISAFIPGLVQKSKDPSLKERLKDCSENYESAISRIKDSEGAIDSKRYSDVNIWVSAAMSEGQSCEDGFEETGSQSPLADKNTKFTHLCSITLTISNLLDENF